jgi:hypothetical protein
MKREMFDLELKRAALDEAFEDYLDNQCSNHDIDLYERVREIDYKNGMQNRCF